MGDVWWLMVDGYMMGDEWWVMSDGWWVMSDEWWVMIGGLICKIWKVILQESYFESSVWNIFFNIFYIWHPTSDIRQKNLIFYILKRSGVKFTFFHFAAYRGFFDHFTVAIIRMGISKNFFIHSFYRI